MRTNKQSKFMMPFVIMIAMLSIFWSSKDMAGLFTDSTTNQPLPKFDLPALNSGRFTNKSMLGHVSLLNVWGSWCGYCQKENSMLLKIKNNYHIPIYGLDLKDNPNDAKSYLADAGNPYVIVGQDVNGDVANLLSVGGTPQTFIVDKHGVIRYRFSGPIEQSDWDGELYPLIKKYQSES